MKRAYSKPELVKSQVTLQAVTAIGPTTGQQGKPA
jgi:hypothetical protein